MKQLKELLGEELYAQVSAKLGETKVIVDDGNFIPKSRFDEINEQKNAYKTQIETLNTQMKEFEKSARGNEELLKQLETMKNDNETLNSKIQDISLTSAIREAVIKAQPKDVDVVSMLIDKSKVKLTNDGKIEGLDDVLKGLKESKSFLFGEDKLGGQTPPAGSTTQKNPWKADSFNLTEQGKLMLENPTLAQKLMSEA